MKQHKKHKWKEVHHHKSLFTKIFFGNYKSVEQCQICGMIREYYKKYS